MGGLVRCWEYLNCRSTDFSQTQNHREIFSRSLPLHPEMMKMDAKISCSFTGLHLRLLDELRHRIHNGEITERGLASLTGISQPHIHNTLKGFRKLSPEFFDLILTRLRLTLFDLLPREEIEEYLARTSPKSQARLHLVPGLSGAHPAITKLGICRPPDSSVLDRHEAHPMYAAGRL
jgi:hypothetical protein